MGLYDVLKDHEPIDLSKKKILQGEAVLQIKSCGLVNSKKTGKDYLTFKAEVINVVKAKEENSIVPGNQFDVIMDLEQDKKIKKLQNNLFTAGLALDMASEEAMTASMLGLENKLVYGYFSKGKFKPDDKEEEIEFQNWKFLPASKLTPENSTPQVPF